jgi:hypothetical protein
MEMTSLSRTPERFSFKYPCTTGASSSADPRSNVGLRKTEYYTRGSSYDAPALTMAL